MFTTYVYYNNNMQILYIVDILYNSVIKMFF